MHEYDDFSAFYMSLTLLLVEASDSRHISYFWRLITILFLYINVFIQYTVLQYTYSILFLKKPAKSELVAEK